AQKNTCAWSQFTLQVGRNPRRCLLGARARPANKRAGMRIAKGRNRDWVVVAKLFESRALQEVRTMISPEEMKDIEFLRPLGEPHLNQIARMASLKECEADTVVFRQG